MDKLLQKITPVRSVGATVGILTVLGWVNQMEFETEDGRIVKAVLLLLGGLAILAVSYLSARAPSPGEKK